MAEHGTRKMLIEELLNRSRLEKLLRDSYGNYCVQVWELYLDLFVLFSQIYFRPLWIMPIQLNGRCLWKEFDLSCL